MRNGRNVWYHLNNTSIRAKSETRPVGNDTPQCPAYNPRRVNKGEYKPYQGNTEWVISANRAMADAARYNVMYGVNNIQNH